MPAFGFLFFLSAKDTNDRGFSARFPFPTMTPVGRCSARLWEIFFLSLPTTPEKRKLTVIFKIFSCSLIQAGKENAKNGCKKSSKSFQTYCSLCHWQAARCEVFHYQSNRNLNCFSIWTSQFLRFASACKNLWNPYCLPKTNRFWPCRRTMVSCQPDKVCKFRCPSPDVIYKQLELCFDKTGNFIPFAEGETAVHTLSYDEKPGIQAIATTSEDRPPVPEGENLSTVMRDYEYKRLGTLSLLAAIDLLTGEAVPLVSETHKSSDFVSFLKLLDEKNTPKGTKSVLYWTTIPPIPPGRPRNI